MRMLKPRAVPTLQRAQPRRLADHVRSGRRLQGKPYHDQRLRVWTRDPRCAICGGITTFEAMELDHVTPLVDGGTTADDNCQIAHAECHREKTRREAHERSLHDRNKIGGVFSIYRGTIGELTSPRRHKDFFYPMKQT